MAFLIEITGEERMARLIVHSVESAPEAAKARVETALKNNGFLPNLIGVLANAPAALAMYQEVGALNATTSLTAGEREVVQITAAVLNECGFCKAGHTALSIKKKLLDPQAIEALRNTQALADPKLNRLALFTQAVMANKGNVGDAELQAFFDAGYNEQQALEVVLGVALATLCNYANNLARTEINEQLQPFA
ncbi:alkylhydroperoxidase AhpD family core domain protein [Neisseria shayeganii 871]|uniref:Alkylhydroperoxidase AhpD family core domain protein n=2 Tax=Neisseria shayeganii TaxID=607712 RepID=G4CI00_9NEIS|nr:alkylhydroperoxidase AhpD family core domain protein [Neisseria shayeganii 871]